MGNADSTCGGTLPYTTDAVHAITIVKEEGSIHLLGLVIPDAACVYGVLEPVNQRERSNHNLRPCCSSHSSTRSLDNTHSSLMRRGSTTMDTCILHPPTSRVLSEEVIGSVVQRPRQLGRPRLPTEASMGYYAMDVKREHYRTPDTFSTSQQEPISPMDRKRKRQDSTDSSSSKLMLLAVSSGTTQAVAPEHSNHQVMTTEWLHAQQEHQREIRRLRQIRYRKKKDDLANTLEDEARQLRQDIEKLEQRRRAVSAAVPTEKTLWNVAVEYFRLFRYGLRSSDVSEQTSSSEAQPCAQLDFLRAAMAPDVMYNAGRGIDSIMTNWKYLSLWFQDVEVELDGLKKCGVDALIAKTTTRLTINKRTLVTVFPHLCTRDSGASGLELAKKLYGQTITLHGSTRFEWDSGYGRVTSVISESDMLTPMLGLLGSLDNVSRVFEKSLISLAPYRSQNNAPREGLSRQ